MTRLSLIVVALAALAACSSTPQAPSQPQVERYGAPAVSAPRDVRPFAPAPCSGPLKAADWQDLGFSPTGAPSLLATGERACAHEGPETERYASITVVPARDVLVDTYRVRQFALFRPTTIGPLPATIEQSSSDDRVVHRDCRYGRRSGLHPQLLRVSASARTVAPTIRAVAGFESPSGSSPPSHPSPASRNRVLRTRSRAPPCAPRPAEDPDPWSERSAQQNARSTTTDLAPATPPTPAAHGTSSVFPTAVRVAMAAWASEALSSGKVWPITGR